MLESELHRWWWRMRASLTDVIDLGLHTEQCGRFGGWAWEGSLLAQSFTELIKWQIQDRCMRKGQSNYRNTGNKRY